MTNIDLRRNLRNRKEALEIRQAFVLDMLGLVVPLAAPLVPAYLTAAAIIEHYPGLLHIDLAWVIGMALIAGAVIEVLGILSIETMFDMRTFNATVQDGDERAPFGWAAFAVAFYLVLVITLVLLLKIWSGLALWSLAPLTVLGFITSWVMVLRKQHGERVWRHTAAQDEQAERDRLNAEIERLKSVHAAKVEQLNGEYDAALNAERVAREQLNSELNALREHIDRQAEQPARERSTPKRKAPAKPGRVEPERIHRFFKERPDASTREAADALGYSIGSISRYKPEPHLNGHSKEVR